MTYADFSHRYPAELIDIVHIADGRRVTVRPILPQDTELLQSFSNLLWTIPLAPVSQSAA